MAVSTITSKGQVTIPKAVRDRLHLRAGDKLDFRVDEDGSIKAYPIAKKVSDVFGLLAERAARRYSADEIKAGLREAFRRGRA